MAKSLKERIYKRQLIKENPVLRLMLGTCATLAVTTAASNAIGMGLATTIRTRMFQRRDLLFSKNHPG